MYCALDSTLDLRQGRMGNNQQAADGNRQDDASHGAPPSHSGTARPRSLRSGLAREAGKAQWPEVRCFDHTSVGGFDKGTPSGAAGTTEPAQPRIEVVSDEFGWICRVQLRFEEWAPQDWSSGKGSIVSLFDPREEATGRVYATAHAQHDLVLALEK